MISLRTKNQWKTECGPTLRKIYSLQGLFQSVSSLTLSDRENWPLRSFASLTGEIWTCSKVWCQMKTMLASLSIYIKSDFPKILTFKWGQMFIDLEGCFGRSAEATPQSAVKGGKTSAMQSDIIARLQREQILYCRHRRSPPRAGEADFRSNRAALIARHKNSQQGPSDSLDRAFGFLGLYNTTMK